MFLPKLKLFRNPLKFELFSDAFVLAYQLSVESAAAQRQTEFNSLLTLLRFL